MGRQWLEIELGYVLYFEYHIGGKVVALCTIIIYLTVGFVNVVPQLLVLWRVNCLGRLYRPLPCEGILLPWQSAASLLIKLHLKYILFSFIHHAQEHSILGQNVQLRLKIIYLTATFPQSHHGIWYWSQIYWNFYHQLRLKACLRIISPILVLDNAIWRSFLKKYHWKSNPPHPQRETYCLGYRKAELRYLGQTSRSLLYLIENII